MDAKHSHLIFKYKNFSIFSRSDTWRYMKADLEQIKEREALSEAESQTEFEAIKRDIKRSNTLRIVNEIINLIERADGKIK